MQTVEQEQLAIEGGPKTVDYKFPTNSDISGRMFGDEEIAELTDVIRSGNLNVLGGPKVQKFEEEWKKTFGVKHAVTSTSGTAALHVGVLAVGPNPGDEIIVAPITDIGSIIAILYQLAVPIFADVDPLTGIVTAETIEPCITERAVAIMVVHLQGNAAVMGPIMELARKHNLLVIEDCSQAHMAAYNGRYAGTIGDIGCYSFQQSKHMTTGDGGMTVTNNDYLGERIMLAHNKGRGRGGREQQPPFLAPNYRMTELQGAVGLAQLRKLPTITGLRTKWGMMLSDLVEDVPGIIPPRPPTPESTHVFWNWCPLAKLEELTVGLDDLSKAFAHEGVGFGAGYTRTPIYEYDVLKNRRFFGESAFPLLDPASGRDVRYYTGMCPNAEGILKRMLVRHINEKCTEPMIHDMAKAIRKVFTHYAK